MKLGARESQTTFRALLTAMSEPGTVTDVGQGGLPRILATLIDHEVRLAELGDPAWGTADFAVIRDGSSGGRLGDLRQGSLEDPAQGATAIYELRGVGHGPLALQLTGPGVGPAPRILSLDGLDPDEVAHIQRTRSRYPRGVDVIFVDREGRCACLPRSTSVSRAHLSADSGEIDEPRDAVPAAGRES